VIAVLMVTVVLVTSYRFTRLQEKEENRLSSALAVILSESVARVSFSGKYHTRLLAEEMLSRVPELAYISVESLDGEVIAHSDPRLDGQRVLPEDALVDQRARDLLTPMVRERSFGHAIVKEIVLPYRPGLDAQVNGVVRLGVKVQQARLDRWHDMLWLLALMAVLSTAAMGLVYLLSRQFGRTANSLADQLQGVLTHAPMAIAITDSGGSILAQSLEYERIFGKPIRGRSFQEHVAASLSGPQAGTLAALNREVVRRAGAEDREVHVEHQGRPCDWHLSIFPIELDAKGGVSKVCSIIRDITDRKQAEEAQQESAALLRTLIDTLPDLVWLKDAQGVYLACNPRFEQFFGAAEQGIVGKTDYDFIDRDQADFFREHDRNAIAVGRPTKNEEEITFADDGHRELLETIKTPIWRAAGKPLGVLGIGRDITERKQAMEELAKSYALNEALLQTIPFPMDIVDAQGNILFLSRMMEQAVGLSALGRHCWTVYKDDRCQCGDCPLKQPIQIGKTMTIETSEVLGGRTFEVSHTGMIYQGKEAVMEIFLDITDRKRAEEDRTRLQRQLLHAQKMESLGSLAGGIAHDMNNVLGAILGLASAYIETQSAGSPIHQAFGTIIKAAERGGKMVKGLLSFARQTTAEECEFSINDVFREVVKLLEHTTLSKVRIELDLTKDLRPIRGDAGALTNAIMNLCINAVDAMPESGTLTLQTRNAGDDHIEARVLDTGTGMTKEILERVLDPFFTTKEQGKGTGLGLSMVYSTIKAHHGQMDIQSAPGRGTCVVLRFPADTSVVQPKESVEAHQSGSAHLALTVLVVDDDELIRGSLEALLNALGHQVTLAESGEEALTSIEAGLQSDLVILDMNMPGLGGKGTLPRLRALRPALPVLLATGRADQTAMDLVANDGKTTLLSKPFTLEELRACLERCVLQRDSQQ
jgi:PAS domain S-box-containing protein